MQLDLNKPIYNTVNNDWLGFMGPGEVRSKHRPYTLPEKKIYDLPLKPERVEMEDLSYSKCALLGMAFLKLVVFVVWTAMAILCMIGMLYNSLAPKALEIKKNFCQVCCHEYLSLLKLIAHFPFPRHHVPEGKGDPILFVHGYTHNSSGWYAQMDRLKKENIGPLYAIDLGTGGLSGKFQSIRSYAAQVDQKAQEIFKATGKKVRIVGHSMGGVVASLASPENVSQIITLGSPLKGAPLARYFGVGPNGRQMTPGSDLLAETEQKIQACSHRIKYQHMGSTMDQVVPCSSALRGSDDNNIAFDHLGHCGLMIDSKVGDKLVDWLR